MRTITKDPNPVSRFFGPPARFLAILSGWWLIALSFLTVAEILLRKFFSISLQGVDEIGGYTTAIVSAFGFPDHRRSNRPWKSDTHLENFGNSP